MARALDVRCGEAVEHVEQSGGRVTGVRLAGGEVVAADVVVSNADVLTRRRPARAARAAAPAQADHVLLPALPRDRPARPEAAAPHAARRRRLQGLHRRRHPTRDAAADVLDLRPRAVALGAVDGGRRRRLDLRPAARPQPSRGHRLVAGGRRPARSPRRRPRDDLRPHRPGCLDPGGAPHDAGGLPRRARGGGRQRLRGGADAAPVRLLPPAEPRPPRDGHVPRRRRAPIRAPASPACCWEPRSPRA